MAAEAKKKRDPYKEYAAKPVKKTLGAGGEPNLSAGVSRRMPI